tara:strand:- start:1 stop:534 length:534 start_codon:yes stop_codon:yes gene_type:complete
MVAYDWISMLIVAMSFSIVTMFQHLNVQRACMKDKTCESTHGVLRDIGFTNMLSNIYYNTYLHNLSKTDINTMARGVCAVGDRPEKNRDGNYQCVPFYPFPSAIDTEIQDTTSASPHMRACGKWIRSGGIWTGAPLYRSMVRILHSKHVDNQSLTPYFFFGRKDILNGYKTCRCQKT